MNLQPQLTGQLIQTRPLQKQDFEDLFKVASDRLIWEVHPEPNRYKREVFQKFFDMGLNSQGCLIIEDRSSKVVLGCSRYYDYDQPKKEIRIGYTFLARKCWGGHYNKELKHLMLTYAFNFVDSVLFDVGKNNYRSRRALEKIGAQLIAETTKLGPDGKPQPYTIFQIRKHDFKGLL